MRLPPEALMFPETLLRERARPDQADSAGRLQGAEVLRMMAEAAHLCASRHARKAALVLARADGIELRRAARPGDLLLIRARIAFQGTSSLTVLVSIFIENAPESGESADPAAFGRFMMVAVDAAGLPKPLPTIQNAPIPAKEESFS